jgi:ABC-2 type transport system permease protein
MKRSLVTLNIVRHFSTVPIRPELIWRRPKLIAVLVWASTTAVGCAAVMLGLGGLLGLAGATPWPGLDRALVGMALTALLALPFALVATIGRSALGGVGAVIGVIVVTQILTVVGTGPWFPYAAPSLWLGMGGPDVTVSTAQLLLVLPVAAAGWAATALWWRYAELASP